MKFSTLFDSNIKSLLDDQNSKNDPLLKFYRNKFMEKLEKYKEYTSSNMIP